MSNTVQVRDIPDEIVSRLRERANAHGISLSAYIRDLLAEDATQQTMDEAVARIATRSSVDVSDEDILSAIHEGRR